MAEDLLVGFRSSFDRDHYPEALLQVYEPLECLANGVAGETLLVRQRQTGEHFVVKCYADRSLQSRVGEAELLRGLHHSGLPAFVEQFPSDGRLWVVREYVEGASLAELAQDHPFTEQQAVTICQQLCDILAYLHGQAPPIIHRDIKPQNIIMDRHGRIKLIDFGISRAYDASAQADTVCFGTQEFAPPEQYGFSQTDGRADIFSLGVLLCWLLTGETRLEQAAARTANKRLSRVIRKCTAFAPQHRYRDAASVRLALHRADGHLQQRVARVCIATMALLAAATAGFALGRFTDIQPAFLSGNSIVAFREPLIEQAVRLQLDKGPGEAISRFELDQVTELYLCGDRAARTWQEFNTLRSGMDGDQAALGHTAMARALADIAKLAHLRQLGIAYQQVMDISVLSGLSDLTVLDLYSCPVADISPLRQLANLTHLALGNCVAVNDLSPLADCSQIDELVLYGCRAADFSALALLGDLELLHVQSVDPDLVLPHLRGKTVRQLRLGYWPLVSFDGLTAIRGLQELQIDQMQMQSLSGIERLTDLQLVTVMDMPQLDLSPLKSLPLLRRVTVSESMRAAASAVAVGAKFEISYR